MRLIDILAEERIYHAPPAEEIAERIKRDCKMFLKESKGKLIYRGTTHTTLDFFTGTVSRNRPPRDTNQEIHDNVNKALIDMGFEAHRGNSVFVTGDSSNAAYYSPSISPRGQAYVIFPIGDYYFTWSNIISDLYGYLQGRGKDLPEDPDELEEFLEKAYRHDDDLVKAIESGNEIMISTEKYYAVDKGFYFDKVKDLIYNEGTLESLEEGVNDPHIFKAIIMAGGPGSGKSFVANRIIGGSGLKVVNSDKFYEYLVKKQRLDMENPSDTENDDLIHAASKGKSERQMDLYINGRLGVLVDGTGRDFARIAKTKKLLDEHGYEVKMVFVDTDIETAKKRNKARDRKVDDAFLVKTHDQLNRNIEAFRDLFGNENLLIVDNSANSGQDFNDTWKYIRNWLDKPVKTPRAIQWKQIEMAKASRWTS